jgi:hypothetical protein
MNYEQKYKKYKQKYFELKNNLFGNALTRLTATDPSFLSPPKPDMKNQSGDYLQIYLKLEELLGKNPDIFILKVGSNDIPSHARCDYGRCYHYIYKDDNILLNDKSPVQLKFMTSLLSKILKLIKDNNERILLQIDPMDESFIPFDDKNEKDKNDDDDDDDDVVIISIRTILSYFKPNEKHYIKGFFPLSRDKIVDGDFEDTTVNKIIKLLVDYNGILLVHNAIGSQCYGIFKVILDLRKLNKKKTFYSGVANDPTTTDCELTIPKFELISENKIKPLDINY